MLPLGRFFGCDQRATVRLRGVLTRGFAIFRSWDIASRRAFLEKFAHFFRRSCSADAALRWPRGSNAEARRASCPELGLLGASMVLPAPGVLSLGRNRIELEIKEPVALLTRSPLGRGTIRYLRDKDAALLASFHPSRFRASSRDSLSRRDSV